MPRRKAREGSKPGLHRVIQCSIFLSFFDCTDHTYPTGRRTMLCTENFAVHFGVHTSSCAFGVGDEQRLQLVFQERHTEINPIQSAAITAGFWKGFASPLSPLIMARVSAAPCSSPLLPSPSGIVLDSCVVFYVTLSSVWYRLHFPKCSSS